MDPCTMMPSRYNWREKRLAQVLSFMRKAIRTLSQPRYTVLSLPLLYVANDSLAQAMSILQARQGSTQRTPTPQEKVLISSSLNCSHLPPFRSARTYCSLRKTPPTMPAHCLSSSWTPSATVRKSTVHLLMKGLPLYCLALFVWQAHHPLLSWNISIRIPAGQPYNATSRSTETLLSMQSTPYLSTCSKQ